MTISIAKKLQSTARIKVDALFLDAGIIRNKLKIRSSISNAQAFIEVQKEFGSFNKYIWDFMNGKTLQNDFEYLNQIPAKTELAEALCIVLKREDSNSWGQRLCTLTCKQLEW